MSVVIDWPRLDRLGEWLVKRYGHIHKIPLHTSNIITRVKSIHKMRGDLMVSELEVTIGNRIFVFSDTGNVLGGYEPLNLVKV